MRAYIIWSGEGTKALAEILKEFLSCIFPNDTIFFSEDNIEKGNRWTDVIRSALNESDVGIVCVTKENLFRPWLNFEAGAISKTDDNRVCSILFGVTPSEISGPLSQFQLTNFRNDDMLKLILDLNKNKKKDSILESTIRKTFGHMFPEYEKMVNQIVSRSAAPDSVLQQDKLADTRVLDEAITSLRDIHRIISRPENLIPSGYIEEAISRLNKQNRAIARSSLMRIMRNVEDASRILDSFGEEPFDPENLDQLLKEIRELAVRVDSII